ncbi:putative molybdenum transport ATP-binding protein (photorepair protein PhrA) [Escherichia coli]|uniref:Putative molybdenum transport ATP-binding protein (Photorepair protein PhrA) n=1 Tax=Escherichia coli TaxID=562 RepID=A0A376RN11_ECOLX|nr:putative molybdenum transport ATP-binding protein (photorepair protein PhrA) [Escherichia coli]
MHATGAAVRITALLDRRFKYLSTGETRKTLLCQALMSEPDLLILDEPFDGLDVASRQQLAERLASLHQSGITLYWCSIASMRSRSCPVCWRAGGLHVSGNWR